MPVHTTIPLPTPTTNDNETSYIKIKVQPTPTAEERNGLTWIVDEPPSRQIGTGTRVRMETETQSTGTVRIGHVTKLRRHWITFAINDTKQTCTLRVPTPWATLSDLESHTHTTTFHDLDAIPRPHPHFRENPAFKSEGESPYEFETVADEAQLTRRMFKIANARLKALRVSDSATGEDMTA